MARKKVKLKINNKLRGALGETTFINGKATKIEINIKKHKGDLKELASTVKHELLHAKHPKMKHKDVYKKSRKTKLKTSEIRKLLMKVGKKYE